MKRQTISRYGLIDWIIIIVIIAGLFYIIISQNSQSPKQTVAAPQSCEDSKVVQPASRAQAGERVTFGTITFDDESRVWILRNFIVPDRASYAYAYRDVCGVTNAPFFTGAELSPVTGERFVVCLDTSSKWCQPPTEIQFFN